MIVETLVWWANALGVATLGALGIATFALFVLVLVSTRWRW